MGTHKRRAGNNSGTLNAAAATKATIYEHDRRGGMLRSKAFARAVRPDKGADSDSLVRTHGATKNAEADPAILRSSGSSPDARAARSGLLSAVMDACVAHRDLVLRPDDVWLAILSQLSFYVNANAEENIIASLKVTEVTEWLLPNFSTTGSADRILASVTVMSTPKECFELACCPGQGAPKITLKGNPDDWRALRRKIDRLPRYDIEGKDQVMAKWHKLLRRVLDEFVASAEGKLDHPFWNNILCQRGGDSGQGYISGWATVFASFTGTGEWQGGVPDSDGWPMIDTNSLPVGTVTVPILVGDNRVLYKTQMLASERVEGSDTPEYHPKAKQKISWLYCVVSALTMGGLLI